MTKLDFKKFIRINDKYIPYDDTQDLVEILVKENKRLNMIIDELEKYLEKYKHISCLNELDRLKETNFECDLGMLEDD